MEEKQEKAVRFVKERLGELRKRPTYGDTMISAELLLHILDTAFPEIKAWEDISDRDN